MEIIDSKTLMKVGMRGYKETVSVNWHGIIITVKTLLSREEEVSLIFSILNCCCLKENNELLPEFLDLSIRANIVSFYTNVELPLDINEQHRLLYHSDLYKTVIAASNNAQINNIISTVRFLVKCGD